MKSSFPTLKNKAKALDKKDPLKAFRKRFALPKTKHYLCNNSLGLPPKEAFKQMQQQMQRWSDLGVDGWFEGKNNWYTSIDKALRSSLAPLLGAQEEEVVVMNSLTVNLHLLLVSFYTPTKTRYKILTDSPSFPSDLYALKSHLRHHGFDPIDSLIMMNPRPGENILRQEDIEQALIQEGQTIALVYLNNVNFLTGQVIDIRRIVTLAHKQGCLVGCDIAHAAGNIPLYLHDEGVDFAVGCSYKYLCSGPGGPGIAFVHASHHHKTLPRFSGWWGNDPKTRFQMHLEPEFIPYGGANSWQLSTPSILSMTPLLASLAIVQEASMDRMRKKSELQTAFLLELLALCPTDVFEVITPRDPSLRGSQISLLIHHDSEKCLKSLESEGMICDFRPPNIIRITPSPLYNTFEEIYEFGMKFKDILDSLPLH